MKKLATTFLILLSVFAGQMSLLNGKNICLSALRCSFENEVHQNCCPKISVRTDETCTNSQCTKRHESLEINGDHQCEDLQIVDINLLDNIEKILHLNFSLIADNLSVISFYDHKEISSKLFYNKSPPKSWHLQFLESIIIIC